MDQAVISTPGLRLRRGLDGKWPPLLEGALRTTGGLQFTHNHAGEGRWSSIKIGERNATQINLRKVEDSWHIKNIRTCFPHWLWGHNGRVILSQEEFLLSIQRYLFVASSLVEPEDRHRLLPGLGNENDSYWQSIEIPFHLPDDEGSLLLAFRNATHPRVNNEIEISKGSVSLKGYLFTIRAYDKLAQMKSKHKDVVESDKRFVRIECRFSREGLSVYLPDPLDSTQVSNRFSLGTLRAAALEVLNEVEGVFLPRENRQKFHPLAEALAAVARVESIPLDKLVTTMKRFVNKTRRSKADYARQAARAFAMNNGVVLSELLNEASQCSGLWVDLRSRKEVLRDTRPIKNKLREAYHDEQSDSVSHWLPNFELPHSWPADLELDLPTPDTESLFEEVDRNDSEAHTGFRD